MVMQEWERLHGRDVIKGWSATVARAQRYFPDERKRWEGGTPCRDCACAHGQLHVPECDMEICPGCGGQLLGCTCEAAHRIVDNWHREGH